MSRAKSSKSANVQGSVAAQYPSFDLCRKPSSRSSPNPETIVTIIVSQLEGPFFFSNSPSPSSKLSLPSWLVSLSGVWRSSSNKLSPDEPRMVPNLGSDTASSPTHQIIMWGVKDGGQHKPRMGGVGRFAQSQIWAKHERTRRRGRGRRTSVKKAFGIARYTSVSLFTFDV
jgi:hypothetical protein